MPLFSTLTKARIIEAVVETNGYTQQKAHETIEILLKLIIDVRTLSIEVREPGSVEIAGAVASEEEKNRAAEIVKNVNGIFNVNNRLSVLRFALSFSIQ